MPNARERWFAEILKAGLETQLATEQDLLAHATPAVLIAALPKQVLAQVLGGALSANAISPRSLVETVSIDLLAEKVPHDVVWACIAEIADRAGITAGSPADSTSARELIRRALASGLDTGVLVPRDVVEHVDAEVLATCFPDDITTKLLEASLAAGKMNPELIVETIGVAAIAQHAPVEVVWTCFVKTGEGISTQPVAAPPPIARPAIEIVDDEVSSILVDLDDEPAKRPPEIVAKPG